MHFSNLFLAAFSMLSAAEVLTATDPDGNAAAHVHKDPHFSRADYHMLKAEHQTVADTTYYIGYEVRWDAVDYQLIVFQWKDYSDETDTDDIPSVLVFRQDANKQNNNITFAVQPDPSPDGGGGIVWSKELTMGKTYQFGIVVNTTPSTSGGFVQLYFNGMLSTMISESTGEHTQKLAGNFFPGGAAGAASPKVGLYGNKNAVKDESYIYNVVVDTTLDDIKEVAGIT
ncbi:hypothetical protein BDV97DRAFT_424290 [Delphinella strobiligena]|nr:hypothetical protein BDV97DRAFT_424290 [Delphinella strobiligena]